MAKDLGLVDELGGIDKALNAAATQAGIEKLQYYRLSRKRKYFRKFAGQSEKTLCKQRNQRNIWEAIITASRRWRTSKNANCIQARMPFDPNIQ